MTKNILAFGASNSQNSINKTFSHFTAQQVSDTTTLLDLNDFEMPIYCIDREKESGIPELAKLFKSKIKEADGIIISFAEHNSSYSTAFKNIFDWISRLEGSTWDNKPMLLLATSPGARGGMTVLEGATKSFSFMSKNSISSFSLPSFHTNFDSLTGITDPELKLKYESALNEFISSVKSAQPILA